MCAISADIGTMHLVKSEIDSITNTPAFTLERNVFLQTSNDSDSQEALQEDKWSYIKYNDNYYITGEDAIRLKNLLTIKTNENNNSIVMAKVGELRRPMQKGVLNTGEEKLSIAIIQEILKKLVGKPKKENEVLCFCAPADPVDTNMSVIFHKTILTNFFKSLGYQTECIPEALAIIFSENPKGEEKDEINGKMNDVPFSGVSCSFGAGMSNIMFAWKKMPLISFSVAKGGDWIDKEAAKIAGCEISVMTKFKEKNLNLDKVDYSDIKQSALDVYYHALIEDMLNNFCSKFSQLENQIDSPLEIVLAGGTASVPGFLNKFKQAINGMQVPFKIKNIRLAKNPLYTVANGCLIKALSVEKNQSKAQ